MKHGHSCWCYYWFIGWHAGKGTIFTAVLCCFFFSFLLSASFSPLSITLRLLGTDWAWAFLALHSIWLGETPLLLSKLHHPVGVLGFQFGRFFFFPGFMFIALCRSLSSSPLCLKYTLPPPLLLRRWQYRFSPKKKTPPSSSELSS